MAETLEDKKRNQKIDELVNSQTKLVKSINQLLSGRKDEQPKVAEQKRDRFLKEKDLVKGLLNKNQETLNKIFKVNSENLKANKTKRGKGLFGLIGGFGSILAFGGLAGYLLTGKKEFLFSTVKGLVKYMPTKILFKPIEAAIKGMAPIIGKGFGSVFKGAFGFLKKGGKFLPKLDFLVKPLSGLFGFVGKMGNVLKPISGLIGKLGGGVAKQAGKGLAKSGGKSALKKIPVLGAVLGVIFGIQRFKKRDIVGGLGELASGVASIFPGPGTAISMAIDGLLLVKDLKGSFGGKKEDKKKRKKGGVSNIPILGPIVKLFKAQLNFLKDPLGSIENVAPTLNNLIPGLGDKIIDAVGWVRGLKNNPVVKGVMKGASAVKKGAGKLFGGAKKLLGLGDPMPPPANVPSYQPKTVPFTKNILMTPDIENEKNSEKLRGLIPGLSFYKKDIDVSGVNPAVWHNFTGMVQEYNAMTGKNVQLNSAYRNVKKQEELYKTKPDGTVAKPGRSLHNFGYALDINSKEANDMERMGLMRKWGFHQPGVKGGWKHPEPWHIEPRGIDRADIRQQGLIGRSEEGKSQIGDAMPVTQNAANKLNTASDKIPTKINNETPTMSLSAESIIELASKIAEFGKQNITRIESKQQIQVDGRF